MVRDWSLLKGWFYKADVSTVVGTLALKVIYNFVDGPLSSKPKERQPMTP